MTIADLHAAPAHSHDTRADRHDARGFSLVEVSIAAGLMLVVLAAVFDLVQPAQGMFRALSEASDVQQRWRVAADTLSRELALAGNGVSRGANPGPLTDFFAPVLPFRQGRRNADPPGTFKTDAITVIHVGAGAAQTTTAQPMQAQSGSVQVNATPGCAAASPACGFRVGTTVVLFDGSGSYDMFSVTGVAGTTLALQHNQPDSGKSYPANVTRIAEATSRTYYLKVDRASETFQLTQYDGGAGADVPGVDHVVGLSFEYYGDPEPPRMRRLLSDPDGPWTTYGPVPPPADVQTTAYPAGENCAFTLDASSAPASRLAVLDAGSAALVRLGARQLTDGPWCPDGTDPNRYDADLLRIRTVEVTLRVESAAAALRGPAGALFTRGGTSAGGHRFVPDHEGRLAISPRNLNLTR